MRINETKSKYFSTTVETFRKKIVEFVKELEPPIDIVLPGKSVRWLRPQENNETLRCIQEFYTKFYDDTNERILVLGINPGRFGGGLTGIPFTDPIRLKRFCQIDSNFPVKSELSAQFFYDHFFEKYSMENFYKKFFIGAVCPLGLESNGKNMNYYDNKELMKTLLEHYIPEHLERQIELGCSRKVAICLGEGLNYSTLEKLNETHQFFDKILKLSHPRFIMQYKRKQVDLYVSQYMNICQTAIELSNE